MGQHGGVAGRAGNAEAEHVAEPSDVAPVRVQFLEDPVFADLLNGHAHGFIDPPSTNCGAVQGCASADEQMRVGRLGPSLFAVGEPCCHSVPDGLGERDDPLVYVQSTVVDVGQLELPHLTGPESMEGNNRCDCCAGWIRGVDGLTQRGSGQRHRLAGLVGAGAYRPDGVEEDDPMGFEDPEQAAQSLPHGGARIAGAGKDFSNVVRGDFTEGGVSGRRPGVQCRERPPQVQADGLLRPGFTARWSHAAVGHDHVPTAQLVAHLFGKPRDGGAEPLVDGRFTVVLEQPGRIANLQQPQSVRSNGLQFKKVGGAQRCPWGVLQAKGDGKSAADDFGRGQAPSVLFRVVEDERVQEGAHYRVGRGRETEDASSLQIACRCGKEHQLAVGHGREPQGRSSQWLLRAVPSRAASLSCAGMAEVGDEELLAEAVGLEQIGPAFPASSGEELMPAEPAALIVIDRSVHAACLAGSLGVLRSPGFARLAEPSVDPAHAPGLAVPTRGHGLRCAAVALIAQPCRVVPFSSSASSTGRRDEGPAGHAVVAELRPARVAPGDWPLVTDTALAGAAGPSHTGGLERLRPSRGTTDGTAPPEDASASFGRAAATFSGSQISSSVGEQFSTAQMTSRSSSRIVVGVPVQSPDILPVLISSPASASRRRSSVDFQIPRSAATIRRFQRILSLSCQPGSQTFVCDRPGMVDVVRMDVDIAGGGREPFVSEQFLDGFQVQAPSIEGRRTVVPQSVRAESSLPRRQPTLDRAGQPGPERVITDPGAATGVLVAPLAREQGRVRIQIVITKLMAHVRQPPLQQRINGVDRRNQPGFGTTAAAALPEPHVDFAVLPEIGAPVLDVEHQGLVDPQPGAAPQRRGQIVAGSRQILPGLGQGITPVSEQCLYFRVAGRDPGGNECRAGGPVEFVDRLQDHVASERMDISLVSGDQEVEEPGQSTGFAFPRGPRLPAFMTQMGKKPVSVRRRRCPQVLAEESGELKDHRALSPDEPVSHSRPDLGEQELIYEFLLEVFLVLLGTQRLAEPDGTNRSKHHHAHPGSAIFRTDHEYHRSFRNHENISDINIGGKMSSYGDYPRGTGDPASRKELTGFETAKVNRTQRSNQGSGNGGGFGNQPSAGQPIQQDDPWAANKQTNAGSWGNGPDSEPPF